jgi:hypothetical protein
MRAMPKSSTVGLSLAREEDVGRLDVAMHHAARMRVGQGVGNPAHELGSLHRRRPPAAGEGLAQVAAAQAFHRDVDAVGRQAGVVHGDDVRVAEAGDGARLVEEQAVERQPLGRHQVELQGLDGHRARQQRVPGLVDIAQPALTELALERIAADVLQRGRAGQVVTRRRLGHRRQGVGQAAVERRRQRRHRRGEVGVGAVGVDGRFGMQSHGSEA